jgi:hypothetical protein
MKEAVGPSNFIEVTPRDVMERFNNHVRSVILRVNEMRDLGNSDRFQFYEHMKPLCASPPDVLPMEEKYLKKIWVLNCCCPILTTNRKDSMYLPADDRRTYVAWSDCAKEDFKKEYFAECGTGTTTKGASPTSLLT